MMRGYQLSLFVLFLFFFFQAEDGIRDWSVTGVQTCALPICIVAMSLVGQSTLILTTNRTSVNQWRRELLNKTDVRAEQIAEYTGERKGIAPDRKSVV